jgi:UDP-N-acetylmuramyl pentapeptide synthase
MTQAKPSGPPPRLPPPPAVGHRDWAATGVSIDTRTLQPGDLFVALKAARDGHDFVAQALAKGAAAALVSAHPRGRARCPFWWCPTCWPP